MKVNTARFTIAHRGEIYLVAWVYTSPGVPYEVQIEKEGGRPEDRARLENTHGEWKPCQTHAFEAVKLALGEDARSQLSNWSEQRLTAKPKPKPLGVYAGPDPCRRCSECEGMTHHWLDNPDFHGEGDATHICKHCEALGDECEACQGNGFDGEPGLPTDGAECPMCKGEGVILDQESIL